MDKIAKGKRILFIFTRIIIESQSDSAHLIKIL